MHFPRLLLMAVVTALVAAPAQARIGETFDQCTERYGRHVRISNDGQVHVFESGRFRIFVEFHDGKADEVIYKKIPPDKDYVGAPLQLSTSEIHTLLKNNFGEAEWKTEHPDLYTIHYRGADDAWAADYSTLSGRLILVTKAAAERLARQKQEADDTQDKEGLENL